MQTSTQDTITEVKGYAYISIDLRYMINRAIASVNGQSRIPRYTGCPAIIVCYFQTIWRRTHRVCFRVRCRIFVEYMQKRDFHVLAIQ